MRSSYNLNSFELKIEERLMEYFFVVDILGKYNIEYNPKAFLSNIDIYSIIPSLVNETALLEKLIPENKWLNSPIIKDFKYKIFMKEKFFGYVNIYYPDFYEILISKKYIKKESKPDKDIVNALSVLGLPPEVKDLSTVRAQYVKLVRQHHPDAVKDSSDNNLAKINFAYNLLKRKLED